MDKKIWVSLGHICLEISNLKKSLKFYKPLFNVTGFKKIWSGKGFAGFSNGDFEVFINHSKPRRVLRKKPSGNEFVISDHLAFLVKNRKDVDIIAETLQKTGFSPLFPPEDHPEFVPGYYAVSFCDPDNIVVEFYFIPKETKPCQKKIK